MQAIDIAHSQELFPEIHPGPIMKEQTSGARPDPVFKWSAREEEGGSRLDQIVSTQLGLPLAEVADLIDFGSVYVQGRIERNPSRKINGGDTISVTFPSRGPNRFFEIDPKRIVYRDSFLLAYDKEAGIPSQQVPSDAYNNVYSALLRFLENEGGPDRYAALHHRLDRETSGLMLFALKQKVNKALGSAFQEKLVRKEYLAWIEGHPGSDQWTTEMDITKIGGRYCAAPNGKGKTAATEFRVLFRGNGEQNEIFGPTEDHALPDGVNALTRAADEKSNREHLRGKCALVLATPLTGRTHQIRIHLAAAGHPILGDQLHGGRPGRRLMLHAFRLVLRHPALKSPLILEAPVPEDFPVPPGLKVPRPHSA